VTIELALAIPVLMAALLAIVDFGGYYNDRLLLTSAAYNGAKARAAACGAQLGQVNKVVRETAVSNPELIEIKQKALGSDPLRRYTVALTYPRPQGTLSLFTRQIAGLAKIEVKALAMCDPDCDICS